MIDDFLLDLIVTRRAECALVDDRMIMTTHIINYETFNHGFKCAEHTDGNHSVLAAPDSASAEYYREHHGMFCRDCLSIEYGNYAVIVRMDVTSDSDSVVESAIDRLARHGISEVARESREVYGYLNDLPWNEADLYDTSHGPVFIAQGMAILAIGTNGKA